LSRGWRTGFAVLMVERASPSGVLRRTPMISTFMQRYLFFMLAFSVINAAIRFVAVRLPDATPTTTQPVAMTQVYNSTTADKQGSTRHLYFRLAPSTVCCRLVWIWTVLLLCIFNLKIQVLTAGAWLSTCLDVPCACGGWPAHYSLLPGFWASGRGAVWTFLYQNCLATVGLSLFA
jgi:hypothetical protein